MRIIVDRIEGKRIVVELPDMTTVDVPKCLLPNAAEGDVYLITKDERYMADRKERIGDKFNRLKKPIG